VFFFKEFWKPCLCSTHRQCFFCKEFWKWPKWLLFARASNLGGYNHKHGHLLNHCTKKIKIKQLMELFGSWDCCGLAMHVEGGLGFRRNCRRSTYSIM
jgi:hypothetical protein